MPLILTRKVGERIMIGDDIVITVLSIRGRQTRLLVDAPKEITILREEVQDRMAADSCPDKRMEH